MTAPQPDLPFEKTAANLAWTQSPRAGVWRKRFVHRGSAERGQVTSLVRFEPGASFGMHPHPEGEEIFVLEGTFSDHRGDFSAGSYMLNAEGFEHAPFSREGCVLFVKLRQYTGTDNVLAHEGEFVWQRRVQPGVQSAALYQLPDGTAARLTRLAAGTEVPLVALPRGEEIFILRGEFEDEYGVHAEHSFLRYPPGCGHSPRSRGGCLLHVCG